MKPLHVMSYLKGYLKFPHLIGRTVNTTIEHSNSLQILRKIIHQKYVFIISSKAAENIFYSYKNVAFHISNEGYISSLVNFAIRKSLNQNNKKRLSRL